MKIQMGLGLLLLMLAGCGEQGGIISSGVKETCMEFKTLGLGQSLTNGELLKSWSELYGCKNPTWNEIAPENENDWTILKYSCRIDNPSNIEKLMIGLNEKELQDIDHISVDLTMEANKRACRPSLAQEGWNAIVHHKTNGNVIYESFSHNHSDNEEPLDIDFDRDFRNK